MKHITATNIAVIAAIDAYWAGSVKPKEARPEASRIERADVEPTVKCLLVPRIK
jgi:hypothetical protein